MTEQKCDSLIDLSLLSVGISVKVDSSDRLRNLSLVVRYFRTFFSNIELIIVEQDAEGGRCAHLAGDGVKHYLLRTADCHFKSRNLNLAASLSTRPYLKMCDRRHFSPSTMSQRCNRGVRGRSRVHNSVQRFVCGSRREINHA